VLIQQIVRTGLALLIQRAFGFGSAEPRPVVVSLLRRGCALGALLEPLKVDHVPHGCLHHPNIEAQEKYLRRHEWSLCALAGSALCALAGSVVIPVGVTGVQTCALPISFRFAKPDIIGLYHEPDQRQRIRISL